jgi:hypothetical protein
MLMRKPKPDPATFLLGYLLDVREGVLFDRRSNDPDSILFLIPDVVVHLSQLPAHEMLIAVDGEEYQAINVGILRRVLETVQRTGELKDDATVRQLHASGCLDKNYAEMLELYRWLKPRADISMWDLG